MNIKFILKTLCVALLYIVSATEIQAQNTSKSDANIHGHVIHSQTREHIPFVTITIKDTTIGLVADASGHYFLKNLPVGEFTIVAEAIGLETVEQVVKTESGKSIEVNFSMTDATHAMDEVVVSATRNETNKKSTATIVNVASAKLFENTASSNLAETMKFQPGLRVENTCGNCGAVQLRINGLDGQYSQILLDSSPIFSSLAGVYGLEQLPVAMIERVRGLWSAPCSGILPTRLQLRTLLRVDSLESSVLWHQILCR